MQRLTVSVAACRLRTNPIQIRVLGLIECVTLHDRNNGTCCDSKPGDWLEWSNQFSTASAWSTALQFCTFYGAFCSGIALGFVCVCGAVQLFTRRHICSNVIWNSLPNVVSICFVKKKKINKSDVTVFYKRAIQFQYGWADNQILAGSRNAANEVRRFRWQLWCSCCIPIIAETMKFHWTADYSYCVVCSWVYKWVLWPWQRLPANRGCASGVIW